MALAIKRAHNLPYFSTLTDITQNLKSYVFFLSIVWVAVSEKNRFWCIWSGSEKSRSVVWLYHTFQPQYQYVCSHSHSITNAVNLSLSAGLFHPIPKQSVISRSCQSCEYCSYITACHYKLAMTSSHWRTLYTPRSHVGVIFDSHLTMQQVARVCFHHIPRLQRIRRTQQPLSPLTSDWTTAMQYWVSLPKYAVALLRSKWLYVHSLLLRTTTWQYTSRLRWHTMSDHLSTRESYCRLKASLYWLFWLFPE